MSSAEGRPESEPGSGSAGRVPGVPRTARDRAVDVTLCLLALAFSVLTDEAVTEDPRISEGQLLADQLTGLMACAALWLRRGHPVGLAAALVPVTVFSHYASGPLLVALFTVAVHRPLRAVVSVGAGAMAATVVGGLLHPDPDLDFGTVLLLVGVMYGGTIGWGMFVRSRRLLLESLRERARRAETEAGLRAERAQRLTRERIAREMHDVLAHRLSLLSVHAGALEYRKDASPEEVAQAAGVIRDSAHAALQDLREVIGVLRSPDGEGAEPSGEGAGPEADGGGREGSSPVRPQPTLAELPRLIAESRQAGMRVTLRDRLGEEAADGVPGAVGRTAYRIVQEGLTNARKHAPEGAVTVTAAGTAGGGLTVEVRNPVPAGEPGRAEIPGAGAGLTGLAERAALAGGRLESGRTAEGDFRLYAWLPWPA